LKTADFDYDLPPNFIAQTPIEPRDHSRLMVYNRKKGEIVHAHFFNLVDFFDPDDVLVLNQTKVIRARLKGRKLPGGGQVEIFLIRRVQSQTWEVLVGGKALHPGKTVEIEKGPRLQILQDLGGARRLVRFDESVTGLLDDIGAVPLPPYIHQPLNDPDRYQTVYACITGSVAAPTAGLHFTKELLAKIKNKGVQICYVTLHVGLDTFSPVTEIEAEKHPIHTEWFEVSMETANQINLAKEKGKKIFASGTTTVRALESCRTHTHDHHLIEPSSGATSLYILPGYKFKVIDHIITNFHLPHSTLIMMVSAFTGREKLLELYEIAKQKDYRFYSFGDAMLIL